MKSLSKLKHYIAQKNIFILTIHSGVRNFIIKGERGEGRPKWISKILKYDVEIQPPKLIKGRALYE